MSVRLYKETCKTIEASISHTRAIVSFGLSSSAVICCSSSHDPNPTEIAPPVAVEPFRHLVTPQSPPHPVARPITACPPLRTVTAHPLVARRRRSHCIASRIASARPPVHPPPQPLSPHHTHSELDAVARHLSQQVLCRLVEAVVLETASNGAAVWSQSEVPGRSRQAREIEVAKGDRGGRV